MSARDKTSFNSQPINKKKGSRQSKQETEAEKLTGLTGEQLREQQDAMRKAALARFLPEWTPREGPDWEDKPEGEPEPKPVKSKSRPQPRPRPKPPKALRTCQGCGNPLPPRKNKWCSETCRKGQYEAQPCVGCGKPTSHGQRNRISDEPRCLKCFNARLSAPKEARRKRVLKLRAQGMLDYQIAIALDCSPGTIARDVREMLEAGIDVPPSNYRHRKAA